MTTLERFAGHLARTKSPRTALAYVRDAEEFEGFRRGRALSIDVVESWAEQGRALGLNPQTTARKLNALRSWLGFLRRHGDGQAGATLDVLRGYAVARGPREADRKRVEPVERQGYLEARERAPLWGAAIVDLLWWAGPRVSEVVGDPLSGIPPLTVADGRRLVREGHTHTTGKGMRRRTLVLPAAGRSGLAKWLDGRGPDAPLFPSPADPARPVSAAAVRQMLNRTGVGHPHRFRHAFKARLRRAGVREEVVRALMGHGPRGTTDRYGAVSVEEMLEAAEAMAAREG